MNTDSNPNKIPAKLLLIFVAFAIGIISCGYLYFSMLQKRFIEETKKELKTIADFKAKELISWRTSKINQAKVFYFNPQFNNTVNKSFIKKNSANHDELVIWLKKLAADNEIESIQLIDNNNNQRITLPNSEIPFSPFLKLNTARAIKSNQIQFVDFYTNEYTHQELISILIPLVDADKFVKPIGLISLNIDPVHFLFPQLQQWPTITESAETFIVRKDIDSVQYLSELRFRKNAALRYKLSLSQTNLPAVKAVLGETGNVDGIDYKGDPVFSYIQPIADTPWLLLVKINKEEALAHIQGVFWMILLILVSLITATASIIIYIWRRQSIIAFRDKLTTSEKLRTSEDKFKKVFENPSTGKAFIQSDEIVIANDTFCMIVGHSQAELKTLQWQNILLPDNLQTSEDIIGKLSSNTFEFIQFEKKYTHKNGKLIWADIHIIAQQDEHQNIEYYFTTIQDITERKTKEIEYRTVIQSSIDGFWINDSSGKLVDVNASLCKMLGYSREELLQMSIWDFDSLEMNEDVILHLQKVKTTGYERLYTNHKCKDGHILDVEVNVTYVPDFGEKFYVFARDVTTQLERQRDLEESEEWFRSLFMQSNDGIFYLNSAGKILLANQAFASMHGYTLEEVHQLNIRELDVNDSDEVFNERMRRLRSGEILLFEAEHYHKNGSTFPIEVSVSAFEIGNERYFLASHRDITERKIATQKIAESENKYRLIAEKTTDVIWLMDLQGKSMYVSPSIKRFTGYTVEEYMQQTIATRFTPESAQKAMQLFSKELNLTNQPEKLENYSISTELEYVCKDGTSKWGELVITPFFNINNVLIGIHGVTRDVTEIRKVKDRELNNLINISKLSEIMVNAINLPSDQNIFELIANQLLEFIPNSIIAINSFNTASMLFTAEIIKDFSTEKADEIRAFQKLLLNEKFLCTAEMFKTLLSAKLEKVHGGIYQATMQQIPKHICKNFETNLGIRDCYTIGIASEHKLLGSIVILTIGDRLPVEKELIEIYASQISSVLMKRDAENALRQSEEQFRVLYEQAPIPYQSLGGDGCILNVNQYWLNELGYKRIDVIGQWFGSFLTKEDAEIFKVRFPKIKSKSIIKNIEYQMLRSDQSIILVSYNGRVIHDENGNFVLTHAVFHNITESRKLFNALHESESQYRDLFNKANDIIFTLDFEGNFKTFNAAAAKLIGLDFSKVTEENFHLNFKELLNDDEYQKAVVQRTLKLEGKREFTMYEVQTKEINGQKYDLEVNSSIRYKDNKPFEVFAIARNITERKQMLQNLESNYEMQIVVNAILNLSVEEFSMNELAESSLKILLNIPWLQEENRACLYLMSEDNTLKMAAEVGLPKEIISKCGTIKVGECICGKVALNQEPIFVSASEHKLSSKLEIPSDHGHYTFPLLMNKTTLGILSLYLSSKHHNNSKEQQIISLIVNAISSVIVRKQAANALQETNQMLESIVKKRTEQLESLNEQLTEDIKIQRQQKEMLKYSENLNKSTLNSIKDMISLIDEDLNVLMVNNAFAEHCNKIFGCDEFIGKQVHEVIKFFNPSHIEKCREVLRNGQNIELIETLTLNGETMFVEVKFIPIIINDATNRVVILMHDISKQKQIKLEILKNLDREKELHLLKSRFVSVISHEFRTPLAGIQSSVELFQKYGHKWDDSRKLELFESIYNNVRYTNLLLDDVSLINKEDEDAIKIDIQNVNIGNVCMQSKMDVLASYKNRKINFNIEPNEIIFPTDEHLLRHILNNVLTNAAKYSGDESDIYFDVMLKEENLVLKIKDHGIGIPPDEMKFAFEPFHRASNVEGIKGTGLGLSIVKRSATMLGGNVSIKSKLKEGTEVIVEIPYTEKKL